MRWRWIAVRGTTVVLVGLSAAGELIEVELPEGVAKVVRAAALPNGPHGHGEDQPTTPIHMTRIGMAAQTSSTTSAPGRQLFG